MNCLLTWRTRLFALSVIQELLKKLDFIFCPSLCYNEVTPWMKNMTDCASWVFHYWLCVVMGLISLGTFLSLNSVFSLVCCSVSDSHVLPLSPTFVHLFPPKVNWEEVCLCSKWVCVGVCVCVSSPIEPCAPSCVKLLISQTKQKH